MKKKEFKRPENIGIDDIISFVFPRNQLYPRTGPRLWLLAEQMSNLVMDENGEIRLSSTKLLSKIPLPLKKNVKVDMKGRNPNHMKHYSKVVTILTDHEVNVLLEDIEVDFIREVYDTLRKTKFYITQDELSEIRANIDPHLLKLVLGYSKKEVRKLIGETKVFQKKGETSNDFLRRIILKDRDRRVKEMKQGLPNPKRIRDSSFFDKKSKKFYNKRTQAVRSTERISDFNSMSFKLHKDLFKIKPSSKAAMHHLTQNCKTLRDPYIPRRNKPGWNKYYRSSSNMGKVKSRNRKPHSLSGIPHNTQYWSGKTEDALRKKF